MALRGTLESYLQISDKVVELLKIRSEPSLLDDGHRLDHRSVNVSETLTVFSGDLQILPCGFAHTGSAR